MDWFAVCSLLLFDLGMGCSEQPKPNPELQPTVNENLGAITTLVISVGGMSPLMLPCDYQPGAFVCVSQRRCAADA